MALGGARFAGRARVMSGRQVGRVTEEMGVAGLAGAGLAGQDGGEGAGFVAGCVGDGSGGQALEGGLDGGEIVEGVEAVGAAAEFAGGLRAAEYEEAEAAVSSRRRLRTVRMRCSYLGTRASRTGATSARSSREWRA